MELFLKFLFLILYIETWKIFLMEWYPKQFHFFWSYWMRVMWVYCMWVMSGCRGFYLVQSRYGDEYRECVIGDYFGW